MQTDWVVTSRQSLRRLPAILRNLDPTFHLDSVSDVTPEFLAAHGLRAVVWDVDGTIMSYHALDLGEPFRKQLRSALSHVSPRHAILSNCDEQRFEILGRVFPEVPIIRGYDRAGTYIPRVRHHGHDSMEPAAVDQLLREGARQVRKPDGRLLRHAAEVLGEPIDTCLMVGDQYLTDVAEANFAGARSAKVPTYARQSFPAVNRLGQRVETLLYRLVRKRPAATRSPTG